MVLLVVLLIRLPFLNQPIQGDDDTYLKEAEHALIEPLHPAHTFYVFRGAPVDLRGHPHPPLDAWTLAGLLMLFGDVKEAPFHAAYIVFSLIAATAMWSLARRFSPSPLWATLLFAAVPAFVVSGNSLESDLPFLAFWMAAIALFGARRLVSATFAMVLAAMVAYQAVLLVPILAVYLWLFRRRDRASWAVLLTAPLTIAAWQAFERLSTGALPAAVLTGYFGSYGFQALALKLRNAGALAVHACFLVFPILLAPVSVLAWRKRREPATAFLLAWIALFFAGAVIVFFAGAARYLLPMAAPVVLLASHLRARWLAAGFAAQLALALGLATVNYQHWDGYRRFAQALRTPAGGHRVWVDGEWGLRYYLESDGALPLVKTQHLRPGDIVVSSALGHAVEYTEPRTALAQTGIRPDLPLRLIGLESRSGFSSASQGLYPFGVSNGIIDQVRADLIGERRVTLQYLPMTAPEAADQIVSGVFADHWMGAAATVVLRSPSAPQPLALAFYIAPQAAARRVALSLDGREIAAQTYPAPGAYTLQSAPVRPSGSVATVEIRVDRTFMVPGDRRDLGIVLAAVGFVQ
ncbi:MAG: hypothetical protein C5B51_00445 [Terriglobia bacterium]|nr:MAG: hypothetical protein C5B51_00445 [Terriglobia bacterium]